MVKNDVFSMVGGLGGDFYKDMHGESIVIRTCIVVRDA